MISDFGLAEWINKPNEFKMTNQARSLELNSVLVLPTDRHTYVQTDTMRE